jgi:hypothetical protein
MLDRLSNSRTVNVRKNIAGEVPPEKQVAVQHAFLILRKRFSGNIHKRNVRSALAQFTVIGLRHHCFGDIPLFVLFILTALYGSAPAKFGRAE